jgi:WD40 repeat protein
LDAHFSADAVNVRGKGLGTSFFGESTEEEEDLSVDSTGMDLVSYTLDEEDVIKALEERVYSMEFYPRSDRILIASGDKRGNLALWTPDTKAEDPIAMYRPHIKPLTQLHFAPHDPTKLVSASYDGIVREFDLQAGMFTELFATEEARDLGLTSMALDQTNGRYLASDDDGHVWSIDARASTSKRSASCYHLHEKKVNTVHVHPTSPQ